MTAATDIADFSTDGAPAGQRVPRSCVREVTRALPLSSKAGGTPLNDVLVIQEPKGPSSDWEGMNMGDAKMRLLVTICAASALLMGTALAEDAATPAANTMTGSSNNAVNSTGNANSTVNASGTITVVAPSALEKGANSFTEGQARTRIESAGFTKVMGLHKDDLGIWRGKGTRNGAETDVGFDYKGNVGAQ